MSFNCGCSDNNCSPNQFPMLAPAPLGPWNRPASAQAAMYQTLVGSGSISVAVPVTYLAAHNPSPPLDPLTFTAVLPNGQFAQQTKQLIVPEQVRATTATWNVTGSFAGGFTTLTFDGLSLNASLQWDGSAWQIIGGTSTPS